MKVLVIGDEHTYGYGLTGGNLSFIGHFIRQIRQAGQPVSVDVYAHLTMAQMADTLAKLPLSQYDLIILQLDELIIQPVASETAFPVFRLPYSLAGAKRPVARRAARPAALGTIQSLLRSIIRPVQAWPLTSLLKQLRPYRHNVLVLTPFPHREWFSQWLRKRSRVVLIQAAEQQLFSVFDTDTVIRPRDEYFLPNDCTHLNAVSHELLGRSLFDFYLSAPTIVTIQAIRRE